MDNNMDVIIYIDDMVNIWLDDNTDVIIWLYDNMDVINWLDDNMDVII